MPSSHSLPDLKTPWRWLTTKAKKKEDPQSKSKRASFTNSTSLAKPEPALHRLQELKSPPPTASPPSTTGAEGRGFKSRPLYRRTGSSPANRPEKEEKEGEKDGLTFSGVNGRRLAPSPSVVMGSAKNALGRRNVGHSLTGESGTADSASVGEDDGDGGDDTGDDRGDTGSGISGCL